MVGVYSVEIDYTLQRIIHNYMKWTVPVVAVIRYFACKPKYNVIIYQEASNDLNLSSRE